MEVKNGAYADRFDAVLLCKDVVILEEAAVVVAVAAEVSEVEAAAVVVVVDSIENPKVHPRVSSVSRRMHRLH